MSTSLPAPCPARPDHHVCLRGLGQREGAVDDDPQPACGYGLDEITAGRLADLRARVLARPVAEHLDPGLCAPVGPGDRGDPGPIGGQLQGGVERLIGACEVHRGIDARRRRHPHPVSQA
jgi:hypothetical protein